MDKNITIVPSYYLTIIATAGWFALISQLYLIILNKVDSLAETIIRYFSFFTITTNIIVAMFATVLLLRPNSNWGNFLSRPTTLTAITVYITIVGVVYNAVLRFLWQPQGLQFVVDELLHSIIPVLFILLWVRYVPKSELKYANAFPWLIYPVIYIIYTAIRGAITNEYPYPFTDVTVLGYGRVALNSLGLFAAFLAFSLFLIAIGKYLSRNKS